MHDLLTEAEREGVTLVGANAPSKVKAELQKIVQVDVREFWVKYEFPVTNVE